MNCRMAMMVGVEKKTSRHCIIVGRIWQLAIRLGDQGSGVALGTEPYI
jgi:hypothetical protein